MRDPATSQDAIISGPFMSVVVNMITARSRADICVTSIVRGISRAIRNAENIDDKANIGINNANIRMQSTNVFDESMFIPGIMTPAIRPGVNMHKPRPTSERIAQFLRHQFQPLGL